MYGERITSEHKEQIMHVREQAPVFKVARNILKVYDIESRFWDEGIICNNWGPEGSGKTTLIQGLLPYFEQKEQKVMATREPVWYCNF